MMDGWFYKLYNFFYHMDFASMFDKLLLIWNLLMLLTQGQRVEQLIYRNDLYNYESDVTAL